MQSDTESPNLIQNYARQWNEEKENGKKCSKRMEIVFHTGILKIVYRKAFRKGADGEMEGKGRNIGYY